MSATMNFYITLSQTHSHTLSHTLSHTHTCMHTTHTHKHRQARTHKCTHKTVPTNVQLLETAKLIYLMVLMKQQPLNPFYSTE